MYPPSNLFRGRPQNIIPCYRFPSQIKERKKQYLLLVRTKTQTHNQQYQIDFFSQYQMEFCKQQ